MVYILFNNMKHMRMIAVGGAMFWLAGCASAPKLVVKDTVGPAPTVASPGKGEGTLEIYSARTPVELDPNITAWRWNNDFGRNEFLDTAHSDYTVYARNGDVLKRVRNSREKPEGAPTQLALPAGSYKVEAEAIDCHSARFKVQLTVVIEPGRTTVAHLAGNWSPQGKADETAWAKLPCGRVIGWRAPETSLASARP